MPSLTHRLRQPEWMDQPDIPAPELHRSLRFIRIINSLLGYKRAIVRQLARFASRWNPVQRIDIVDLATGSADIPLAILRWADRKGLNVHIVGIDKHPLTTAVAAERSHHPNLRIVQADVFNLPFQPHSFDYAISAMFLHHLDDTDIIRVLRTMDRLSRRGIIASDLLRHRRAHAWINLLTLPCGQLLRHDATVSVAQSLTKPEVLRLRDQAALPYARYHRHFAHRWTLAGEKL